MNETENRLDDEQVPANEPTPETTDETVTTTEVAEVEVTLPDVIEVETAPAAEEEVAALVVETEITPVAEQETVEVVEPPVVTESPEVAKAPEAVETVEAAATEEAAEPSAAPATEETAVVAGSLIDRIKAKWNRRHTYTVAAVAAALVVLVGVVFVMERQGKVETGLFDGIHQIIDSRTAVAHVNDGMVSKYDLDISMSQMAAGFAAQGIDTESEEVKSEIQTRAVDMLVNTELLKQEASVQGIEITDEDVTERLEKLKADVGGEDVLNERMAEFGVTEKTLRRDIKNELTIQALLDKVFVEKKVEVTDAEVKEFYDNAKGEEKEFPPLADVAEQIKQQLKSTKEQEVVTAYIEELRSKAEIEVVL
jgi:hypothetical protein